MAFHYEDAPITEALIDIRVTLPDATELESLESIHERVKDSYPGKRKGVQVLGLFSGGGQVGASATQTEVEE